MKDLDIKDRLQPTTRAPSDRGDGQGKTYLPQRLLASVERSEDMNCPVVVLLKASMLPRAHIKVLKQIVLIGSRSDQ
jgi:hypothetical protein